MIDSISVKFQRIMDKRAPASDISDATTEQSKTDNQVNIEPWMPRGVKILLDLNDIKVSLVNEGNFKDTAENLKVSKYIGLAVLGVRKKYPLAVCLTTHDRIHVFHYREILSTQKFLRAILHSNNLNFFMVDGIWASALLYKWKIKLRDCPGIIDLQCMDMQTALMDHMLSYGSSHKHKYGITYVREHVKPMKYELEELVKIWMGGDVDLNCTQKDIEHLRKFPYDVKAINVIKKQASLVRVLGITMKRKFEEQVNKPSKAIFSLARRADNQIREEYDRRGSKLYSDLCTTLGQCPSLDDWEE